MGYYQHTHTHTHIHTYTLIHTHTYTHTDTHTQIHTYIYTHTYTYTHIHTQRDTDRQTDRQTYKRLLRLALRKKESKKDLTKWRFQLVTDSLGSAFKFLWQFSPLLFDANRLPNPRKLALELHGNCSETVMTMCVGPESSHNDASGLFFDISVDLQQI